jgi:hypothetical protein
MIFRSINPAILPRYLFALRRWILRRAAGAGAVAPLAVAAKNVQMRSLQVAADTRRESQID